MDDGLKEVLKTNFSNAESTEKFLENINPYEKNSMVPKPPKKGEIIVCQLCGKEMLPKDFSKDKNIRKREFKWHIHNDCFLNVDRLLDLRTIGLLDERR